MKYRLQEKRPLSLEEIDANFKELATKIEAGIPTLSAPDVELTSRISSDIQTLKQDVSALNALIGDIRARVVKLEGGA